MIIYDFMFDSIVRKVIDLEGLFKLKQHNTTLGKEVSAGFISYITSVYIIINRIYFRGAPYIVCFVRCGTVQRRRFKRSRQSLQSSCRLMSSNRSVVERLAHRSQILNMACCSSCNAGDVSGT